MTRNDLASTGFSTPDSCGVTIAGSALHGRDLGIRLWFIAPSRPVCPEGCPKARIVVGACEQCVYGVGPARAQSGRCKGRGQIRSGLGCQRLLSANWVGQCAA